ncbi:MAG: glycosyltransferase [Mycobacteriales bacterium]
MTRVLHVVRDWVRPSEGFVADVVGRSASPAVAFGFAGIRPELDVPSYRVGRLAGFGDKPVRYALAAVAWRRRAQLLHAHFGYWAGHAEAVARRTGRPWSLALHGHDLLVEGCAVAARANRVVVPSRFLADAASRAGVPDERLRVIPPGLALDRFPFRERVPSDRPPTVVFAGRYVEKKGVLDVARALAGVPGIRRVFVGHGPQEQQLRTLLAELGTEAELADGAVPGAVARALQEADLVVTGSKLAADGDAETLGLVNLEALACGAPVVTTRTGGVPEAVGDAAVLVDEGDVPALQAQLQQLVDAPGSWAEIGRRGRAHVEARYAIDDRVADLEAMWDELVR